MVVVGLVLLGEKGHDLSVSDLQLTNVSSIEVGVVGGCVTELVRKSPSWPGYLVEVKMPMTGDLPGRAISRNTSVTARASLTPLSGC